MKFFDQLKSIWFLLVFFAFIVIWYAGTNYRLAAVEAKQTEQEITNQQLSQALIDIAVIKTNVEFIKERVK